MVNLQVIVCIIWCNVSFVLCSWLIYRLVCIIWCNVSFVFMVNLQVSVYHMVQCEFCVHG